MKSRKNSFNRLLVVSVLFIILQAGCSSAVKKPHLLPMKPGLGLSEISNPEQFPEFRDDYDKELLLQSINNSIEYLKKTKSYPKAFSSIGFTPEKQKETLEFFREGYILCKNAKELNDFVSKNFRVFQAIGKMYEGEVHFTGYGLPFTMEV